MKSRGIPGGILARTSLRILEYMEEGMDEPIPAKFQEVISDGISEPILGNYKKTFRKFLFCIDSNGNSQRRNLKKLRIV